MRPFLIAALATSLVAPTQSITHGTNRGGFQGTQAETKLDAQLTLPIAVQNDIHDIATALDAANKKQPSATETERENTNLKAQRKIARWAKFMFFVAALEALVTLAGVILVGMTLKAARRSANAAEKTLAEMDENGQRELRAYLSVEPAGINQLIASKNCIGQVVVRNVGKVPAKNVFVKVGMKLAARTTRDFQNFEDESSILRSVQPNAQMRQGSADELDVASLTSPNNYIFVWGVAYYYDGFSTARRYTRFCHRYHCASYDRLQDWNTTSGLSRIFIAADRARYHEQNNDTD